MVLTRDFQIHGENISKEIRDLTGRVTVNEEILLHKENTLIAGENITLDKSSPTETVISAESGGLAYDAFLRNILKNSMRYEKDRKFVIKDDNFNRLVSTKLNADEDGNYIFDEYYFEAQFTTSEPVAGGGTIIAISNQISIPKAYVSKDGGLTYKTVTLPATTMTYKKPIWTGSYWLALTNGNSSAFITSTDGLEWITRNFATSGTWLYNEAPEDTTCPYLMFFASGTSNAARMNKSSPGSIIPVNLSQYYQWRSAVYTKIGTTEYFVITISGNGTGSQCNVYNITTNTPKAVTLTSYYSLLTGAIISDDGTKAYIRRSRNTGGDLSNTFIVIDVAAGTYTQTNLPTNIVTDLPCVKAGGYVICPDTNGTTGNIYLYNMASNSWTTRPCVTGGKYSSITVLDTSDALAAKSVIIGYGDAADTQFVISTDDGFSYAKWSPQIATGISAKYLTPTYTPERGGIFYTWGLNTSNNLLFMYATNDEPLNWFVNNTDQVKITSGTLNGQTYISDTDEFLVFFAQDMSQRVGASINYTNLNDQFLNGTLTENIDSLSFTQPLNTHVAVTDSVTTNIVLVPDVNGNSYNRGTTFKEGATTGTYVVTTSLPAGDDFSSPVFINNTWLMYSNKNDNIVMWSKDAKTWNKTTLPFTALKNDFFEINGLIYINTQISTPAADRATAVSADGMNWQLINAPSNSKYISNITDTVYVNNMFIMPNSNYAVFSRDGITWNTGTSNVTNATNCVSVVYIDKGYYMMAYQNGNIRYENLEERIAYVNTTVTTAVTGVWRLSSTKVLVTSATARTILTLVNNEWIPDVVTFQSLTNVAGNWNAPIYKNKMWVATAATAASKIVKSYNGIDWLSQDMHMSTGGGGTTGSAVSAIWNSPVYLNNTFYFIGRGSPQALAVTKNLTDIYVATNKLDGINGSNTDKIILGNSFIVITAVNGNTSYIDASAGKVGTSGFDAPITGTGPNIKNILYSNNKWVAHSGLSIMESQFGNNWNTGPAMSIPVSATCFIITDGEKWMLVPSGVNTSNLYIFDDTWKTIPVSNNILSNYAVATPYPLPAIEQ